MGIDTLIYHALNRGNLVVRDLNIYEQDYIVISLRKLEPLINDDDWRLIENLILNQLENSSVGTKDLKLLNKLWTGQIDL